MNKIMGMVASVNINDEMWCVSRIWDGLYKVCITTGKVDYVCELPEKNELDRQAYTDILYCEGKLYFIPAFAKNIAVYDINEEKIAEINVSQYFIGREGEFNIGGGCIYGNWLYLYPCLSNILMRINIKNYMTEVDTSYIYDNNLKKGEIFAYHRRHYQINNELYIALASFDGVLCIDMNKFQFKVIPIPNNDSGYAAVVQLDSELWLAPNKKGAIVRYNIQNHRIERFENYPSEFKRSNGLAFSDFVCFNSDELYLLPFCANMIIKINAEKKTMEELKIRFSEPWLAAVMEDISSINIQSSKRYDDKYYLLSESLNRMLVISSDGEIAEVQFNDEDEDMNNTIFVKESRGFVLHDFLSYVSR